MPDIAACVKTSLAKKGLDMDMKETQVMVRYITSKSTTSGLLRLVSTHVRQHH